MPVPGGSVEEVCQAAAGQFQLGIAFPWGILEHRLCRVEGALDTRRVVAHTLLLAWSPWECASAPHTPGGLVVGL